MVKTGSLFGVLRAHLPKRLTQRSSKVFGATDAVFELKGFSHTLSAHILVMHARDVENFN